VQYIGNVEQHQQLHGVTILAALALPTGFQAVLDS
jgi:hypothetical protein